MGRYLNMRNHKSKSSQTGKDSSKTPKSSNMERCRITADGLIVIDQVTVQIPNHLVFYEPVVCLSSVHFESNAHQIEPIDTSDVLANNEIDPLND